MLNCTRYVTITHLQMLYIRKIKNYDLRFKWYWPYFTHNKSWISCDLLVILWTIELINILYIGGWINLKLSQAILMDPHQVFYLAFPWTIQMENRLKFSGGIFACDHKFAQSVRKHHKSQTSRKKILSTFQNNNLKTKHHNNGLALPASTYLDSAVTLGQRRKEGRKDSLLAGQCKFS